LAGEAAAEGQQEVRLLSLTSELPHDDLTLDNSYV